MLIYYWMNPLKSQVVAHCLCSEDTTVYTHIIHEIKQFIQVFFQSHLSLDLYTEVSGDGLHGSVWVC